MRAALVIGVALLTAACGAAQGGKADRPVVKQPPDASSYENFFSCAGGDADCMDEQRASVANAIDAATAAVSGVTAMSSDADVMAAQRNLSTILRHRRFLFTDSLLLLWK